ncbi:Sodium/hydrogen exchanger 4 [Hibiscus syriacus]|uniref:Sodium/hydrogen exchanger 4 n=1 Tax=Hibiscus syriacus TaxID=106335 RepID=A0A6A3ALP3_HIBSY|nr:Sodium/hydrogen exchanger 4 [Hibiscus syriacus]
MEMFELMANLAHQHEQVVPVSVFVAILCLWKHSWNSDLVIEQRKSSHILRFDEQLFFIYLLPPIIFNAGFQVKKKQFFQNFITIMLFGVIGVFISSAIVTAGSWWLFPKLGFGGLTAREYLAVGTIFSSTDIVCTLQVLHQDENSLLYSLVFREGVVNDATSVVLFNAIQKIDVSRINSQTFLKLIGDFIYLFPTSTALGVTFGLVTAYLLKTLFFGRHSTVRELAIMLLMAYLSYMLAELLDLSGILTVFFCGILMSHYASHIFAMMSFVAETFIFLYVGMDALDMEKWKMTRLSFTTLMGSFGTLVLLILLGRAAFVFPLSVVSNLMNRRPNRPHPLTFKHQVVIWWAGLMRGEVSIALAFKQFTFSGVTWDPVNAAMITNTIIVVLFTTMVGIWFLNKAPYTLHASSPCNRHERRRSRIKIPKGGLDLPILSFEESATTNILRVKDSLSMLFERPVYMVHYYWRKFDDKNMRPVLGGPCSSSSSEC